jgi:hypothetical protein
MFDYLYDCLLCVSFSVSQTVCPTVPLTFNLPIFISFSLSFCIHVALLCLSSLPLYPCLSISLSVPLLFSFSSFGVSAFVSLFHISLCLCVHYDSSHSTYVSLCLFLFLSVSLSLCLSVYLSLCLSISKLYLALIPREDYIKLFSTIMA